ncbi:MAG: hypothetical protein AAF655_00660 [Bacteroidota bacterium]
MMKRHTLSVTLQDYLLHESTKKQMWKVYSKYYHYSYEEFMKRIPSNDLYSFYLYKGEVVGFTGLRVDKAYIQGKRQLLIYFGQTVIEERFRGKSLIPVTGFKLCCKYWKAFLRSSVYMYADSLTYKAYLVFAKTVEEMYPSRKRPNTPVVNDIFHLIGNTYYKESYNEASMTIGKDRMLVDDKATCNPIQYIEDEDIRFYVEKNPLWHAGHGLLTLAPMNLENLKTLLVRMFKMALGWKSVKKVARNKEIQIRQKEWV